VRLRRTLITVFSPKSACADGAMITLRPFGDFRPDLSYRDTLAAIQRCQAFGHGLTKLQFVNSINERGIRRLRARTIIDGDVSTQSDGPRREKWFSSAIQLSRAPAMS
jgi:hypothetical protein